MAQVSLIVAVAANGVIGRDGDLAVRIAADMAYFKDTTMGKPVVMGRKTYESIPPKYRPLPGRRNIVITRDASWSASGAVVANGWSEAVTLAGDVPEIMVAGGGEIYAMALPHAGRLYVTEIHEALAGDVTFPPIDHTLWKEVSRKRVP
jgi:dihydrofolate reductase